MRYSVLGGAFQVSVPDRRSSIQSRPWLLRAATDCAAAPARWLQSGTRRTILTVVLGAAALGVGAGARAVQQRYDAMHPTAATAQQSADLPSVRSGYLPTQPVTAASAAATAASALGALEQPAYALSASAAQALDSVRLTVADAAVMQQLRTQIAAPAAPTTLSGPALAQLIALVQQSQVASAATGQGAVAVDPVQLAQSQTAVRSAQQALTAAVAARDAATPAAAPTPAAAAAPAAPPSSATASTPVASASAAAAATPASAGPALVAAEQRLLNANQHLSELLNVQSPAAIAAVQKTVQDALNATPQAPTADQLTAAQTAVSQTAQAYADAATSSGPQSAPAVGVESRTSAASAAHPSARPDPVAAPVRAPNLDTMAALQGKADAAKAALASLQKQAAYAADPESQPAVIEARKALTALTAPPDPAALAAAQAEVTAAQQAVSALQPPPAAAAAPAPVVTASATVVVPASAPAPSVVVPSSISTAATTVVPRTAPPADPVAAAEQRLTDAQKQLATLVSGSSTTALPSGSTTTALPAGSTTTSITPAILAAQGQVSTGAVSQGQLSEIEIDLRARYVTDAVLSAAHLHPSALTQPAAAQFPTAAATATVAQPLAWPVVGPITQPFGVPELGVGLPHTGIDIGVPVGTPVLAAAPGVVTFAGGDPSSGYGYYAIIDHGGGVSTLYGHLALPPLLHAGQFLPQGGLIGLSGSTGFSTGPHVHFEVRLNATPVDPLKILPANPH